MRTLMLALVAVAVLCVGTAAYALVPLASPPGPDWWDSYQHIGAADLTITGVAGDGSGTSVIVVDNDPSPVNLKHVYGVVDWWADAEDIQLLPDVAATWGFGSTVLAPIVNTTWLDGQILKNRYEYELDIFPQPAFDKFTFSYVGVHAGEHLNFDYDFRTICVPPPPPGVPEPGALMLVGVGLAGLVLRKRNS